MFPFRDACRVLFDRRTIHTITAHMELSQALYIDRCATGALAVEGGEDVGGLGTDAEVCVGLGEGDGVGLVDDEDGREGKSPTGLSGVVVAEAGVVERNVDEDGPVVAAVRLGDGVGDAEVFCEAGAGVGEKRVAQAVLLEGEVVLAGGLGRDADEKGTHLAELGVEIAPGFELRDAVGVPAAAEEVEDEGAEGEEIRGADGLVGEGVLEGEVRSLRADAQDAVFDAGVEEVFGRSFGDGETFGLDEGAGVLGDAVEPVLERDIERGSHNYIIAAIAVVVLGAVDEQPMVLRGRLSL
jgi:hypothetical protein